MKDHYEIIDGVVHDSDEFTYNNRAFKYGDGLFESIKVASGNPLFLEDHFVRLQSGMRYLKLDQPSGLDENSLKESIKLLCKKNEFKNAKARLTVFRNSDGFYTPNTNNSSWHLSVIELPSPLFTGSDVKIKAGLYRDEFKATGRMANFKTLNCLVYVLASIFTKEQNWDDALIMNSNHAVIEATSSNVFFRKEKTIITPPLTDGCLEGVMRKQVINVLGEMNYDVEEKSVFEKDLNQFDEMFITNAVNGARNIHFYLDKPLETGLADEINNKLNIKPGLK